MELGVLNSMLGPTIPLYLVQACLHKTGVPHDSPLEGQSTWDFALTTPGKATRCLFNFLSPGGGGAPGRGGGGGAKSHGGITRKAWLWGPFCNINLQCLDVPEAFVYLKMLAASNRAVEGPGLREAPQ